MKDENHTKSPSPGPKSSDLVNHISHAPMKDESHHAPKGRARGRAAVGLPAQKQGRWPTADPIVRTPEPQAGSHTGVHP